MSLEIEKAPSRHEMSRVIVVNPGSEVELAKFKDVNGNVVHMIAGCNEEDNFSYVDVVEDLSPVANHPKLTNTIPLYPPPRESRIHSLRPGSRGTIHLSVDEKRPVVQYDFRHLPARKGL